MMSELDEFLSWVETRQREAEVGLLNGDAEPRLAIWSRNDPVTLLGAWFSATGWEDVSSTFQRLGSVFSDCTSYERDIIAAGVSGDLAYTVGYERITVSVNGTPSPHTLRATHVYRREEGEWKVVHRHADPPPTPLSEGSD
jgi:ketosteroid isomerase-like protein